LGSWRNIEAKPQILSKVQGSECWHKHEPREVLEQLYLDVQRSLQVLEIEEGEEGLYGKDRPYYSDVDAR
jgi:hypothetical protein